MDWLLVTCATIAVSQLSSVRRRIGLWKSRSEVESDAAIPRERHPVCPARRIHQAHHCDCWLSCVEGGFVAGAARGGMGLQTAPAPGPYAAPAAAVLLT